MAKRVQISSDGSTFYTFPGSKGELTREGGPIKDTIFGYDYQSDQIGLIGWQVSTNGVYKGFAGYKAVVKKSGTTTAFTDEAMTLVSGKTYKITNTAKNVWDRSVTPTFEDGGGAISSSNVESVDYLFGRVTFISAFTPSGSVTVTGSYLPLTQVAKTNQYTLTMTAAPVETSTFDVVQANGGYRTFQYGLKTVTLALKGVYASSSAFAALLAARSEAVVEICPDGSSKSVARGWFKPMANNQMGDVGELEEEELNFNLSVPDQSDVAVPFKWLHDATTTLNTALQKALTAWEGGLTYDVRYLYDGTNGQAGDAIVVDVSLSGGLETMNDFSVKFQGTGALADHP
jgi:hypothetical protein